MVMKSETVEVVGSTLLACLIFLAIAGVVFFCGYMSGDVEGRHQMRLEAISHGYGVLVPGKPGAKPAWRWIESDGE